MKVIAIKEELDKHSLEFCVRCLNEGQIVCYPTETFYALGIDPWNPEARSRLYALKGRASEKELPLIAVDTAMVEQFCCTEDPRFQVLVKRFWPGPLTLVLKARDEAMGAFAVRVSSHAVPQQLTRAFQKPVVSTSANRSGEPPVSDPHSLPFHFQQQIEILIDGGVCQGGSP